METARAAGGSPAAGERSLFGWYGALGADGRRAFWAAFGGTALAGFDLLGFTFVLDQIRADFGLSEAQVGFLATASLLSSAVGGVVGGAVADGLGRVHALMLSVLTYALATFAGGFAQGYEQLLLCRVVLGLGFGGEWTAGALIVAEYAPPAGRGRALGAASSGFVVGDALAAVAAALLAGPLAPGLAWRILFWLGVLPALLLIWMRRALKEPPVARAATADRPAGRRLSGLGRSFGAIVAGSLLVVTAAATALSFGALSGRYVVTVWVPTFLRTARDFGPAGVSLAMLPLLVGAWLGYLLGGYAHDLLGRRRAFALFAVASAIATWLYVAGPGGDAALVPVGALLGFCTSGVISGLGAYLAELYPSAIRGIGQGFTFSTGRALAALPVALVGGLASGIGIGPAIAGAAAVYLLCLLALPFLPETRGKALT